MDAPVGKDAAVSEGDVVLKKGAERRRRSLWWPAAFLSVTGSETVCDRARISAVRARGRASSPCHRR